MIVRECEVGWTICFLPRGSRQKNILPGPDRDDEDVGRFPVVDKGTTGWRDHESEQEKHMENVDSNESHV